MRRRSPRRFRTGRSERLAASRGLQTLRGFRPSRKATDNALVGLLTPEQLEKLAFSSRLRSTLNEDRPADNGLNQLPLTLGYSGGAVPEFHRSSLFCRPFQQKQPTTNARLTPAM